MSIRKSFLVTSLALATIFSTSIMAGGTEAPAESPFTRGYLGVGLGLQLTLANASTNLIYPFFPAFSFTPIPGESGDTLNSSANLGKAGFLGNLHLGYGHSFDNFFYLGGEIFGEWGSGKAHLNESANIIIPPVAPVRAFNIIPIKNHFSRVKSAYGIVIHPGLQPTPWSLVYLTFGVAFGQIRIKDVISFSAPPLTFSGDFVSGAPVVGAISFSKHTSKAGFRVGLGTAIILSHYLAFRLEYFYTGYGRRNSSVASPTTDFVQLILNRSAKIHTHAVTANLDFLF